MSDQFGNYLNTLRINRGLTVRKLSNKSGLSASHISNIENGTKLPPRKDSLNSLCKVLDLSSEEQVKFFNLAAYARSNHKDIPEDLLIYMSNNKETINVIKLGKFLGYNDVTWKKIIKFMDES